MDDQFARGYLSLGRILAARGQFVEAGRAFAKAEALDGTVFGAYLRAEIAAADAGAGHAAQARRFLASAEGSQDTPAELIGFVYARLGDLDKAFEWIGRGIDERSNRLLWLKVDPRVDPSEPIRASIGSWRAWRFRRTEVELVHDTDTLTTIRRTPWRLPAKTSF